MGNVTGTPRKVVLDGITFDVFADANITEIGSAYENENIPTSGKNMLKKIRRSQNRESVVVAANGAERDVLRTLSERTIPFSISYELASGDIYRATGFIEFENRETEENRATIQLLPENEWTAFLA